MDVPEIGEPPNCFWYICPQDDHIEVDDRFGSETGNGRAPDMFDTQHDISQRKLHGCGDCSEALWPYRVILANQ